MSNKTLLITLVSFGFLLSAAAGWCLADASAQFKQAGDYVQNKQRVGTTVRVFGADYCMDESVAGSGPIEISRDPTIDSNWVSEIYIKP